MRYSNTYKADIVKNWDVAECVNEKWKPARPMPFYGLSRRLIINQIRRAWYVLIGRYDALSWD